MIEAPFKNLTRLRTAATGGHAAMIGKGHTAFALAAALVAALICASPAHAEKADRDKPINVEADRMEYDDKQQISTFTGDVVLTKGTIEIRGDRLIVRQDPAGWQYGTAIGEPASFRQKREGVDEWIEGRALQIDYDGRQETVRLQQRASMQRVDARRHVLEEVHGSEILYESGTEFFTVEGGDMATTPANPSGRVRVVIQPRGDGGGGAAAGGGAATGGGAARVGPPTTLQPSERLAPR